MKLKVATSQLDALIRNSSETLKNFFNFFYQN